MPGSTFGLTDTIASRIHSELHLTGRFDPDLARGVSVGDREGIRSAPILGVIGVNQDKPLQWVKAGQLWQRLALKAEKNGMNTAINAAIVEVDLLNAMLKTRLGTQMRPTVIFRLGYATEDRPHSPRLPVENVLIAED